MMMKEEERTEVVVTQAFAPAFHLVTRKLSA